MAISRLQLAAALLEYDNLDGPPSRPPVSHRDSALFKPFEGRPEPVYRSSQDGVRPSHALQSSFRGQNDPKPRVRTSSHSSSSNPPALAENVDLDRWDLPSHLIATNAPPPAISLPERKMPPVQTSTAPSRPLISSSLSDRIGSVHLDVVDGISQSGESVDVYDEANDAIARARRVQSMFETRNPSRIPLPASPTSPVDAYPASVAGMVSRGSMDGRQDGFGRHSWDYGGSQEVIRPASAFSRSSYDLVGTPEVLPQRPGSSYIMIDEPVDRLNDDTPNPFALPPPPPEIGSRFDPKTIEAQRRSVDLTRPRSRVSFGQADIHPGNMYSSLTEQHLQKYLEGGPADEPNPLAGREFKVFKDVPTAEQYGRSLRPSKYGPLPLVDRRSLLRPKTLIMPSLLAAIDATPPPPVNVPEGYTIGDKPLPPGSRSSILTTDPRQASIPLSLSQRTFRSSLLVGGKREDEEYWVGGTTEEGEVGVEYAGEGDPLGPVDRRPGKLYGKSLMDQLEARKSALKSKQRAFAGDLRPAMMARASDAQSDAVEVEHKHHHMPRQPLLTMDSSGEIDLTENVHPENSPSRPTNRMTKSRSVFGVDKIWEKEMAKLKVIQDAEARAAADKEAKEATDRAVAEGKKKRKKGIDWRKSKGGVEYGAVAQEEETGVEPKISPLPQVSALPPQISYSPERAPRAQIVDPETDEVKGDERDLVDVPPEREEEQDDAEEFDSEEDVPLSRIARAKTAEPEESDSEEDVPLAAIKRTISPSASMRVPSGVGSLGLDPRANAAGSEGDEDDMPLGVRRTVQLSAQPIGPVEDVEDDLPLGFKHANAVVRQTSGQWRNTVTPHYLPPNPMMPWGYPNVQSGMMSPYGYNANLMPPMAYGMANPMIWSSSSLQLPLPGMQMPMPMGLATPEVASRNIDSWRKEVAIQPVPTGASSIRSASAS